MALEDQSIELQLGDVVRVVQQSHEVNASIDPVISAPVVQILLDNAEPWNVSDESFVLLADWLQALVFRVTLSGDELRIRLRARLIAYWESFPRRDPSNDVVSKGMPGQRRRRRELDYHLTNQEFVETLALLGPDVDDAVEACLRAIAGDAPAFLAPAVDSPWSARALALKSPDLLAELMEAYYVDNSRRGYNDKGVRDHQGRWYGPWPPYAQDWFGGFWQLFQVAPLTTSARVLNNILNSGARARVGRSSRHTSLGVLSELAFEPGDARSSLDEAGGPGQAGGAVLNLDGTARLYVGDTHVWSWYRGTTVGPNPAMSALQAMERLADNLLRQGAPARWIVETLLEGCENLATPGMLFGTLVRHIEIANGELDAFLAEPAVWDLEFVRQTHEYSGLRATTAGLANPDRRQWTPREVAAWLAFGAGEDRVEALRAVGELLIQNGDRLGIGHEHTMSWAAALDRSQYQVRTEGDQHYLEVVLSPELEALREARAAEQAVVQTILRLQNRYWGSAKFGPDYVPPSSAEIAADLTTGRSLTEADVEPSLIQPFDAVAHVVRAAVQRAVAGDMQALGDEARFATEFVLGIALSFRAAEDQRHEGQYFDQGADRAVAEALPAFVTPAMTALLDAAEASIEDVDLAGLSVAGRASLETRLFLARGCDVVWTAPCDGEPCHHRLALTWMVETARAAELAPWGEFDDTRPDITIDGDVGQRLQDLDSQLVNIGALDAAVRGLGASASADHCCTDDASTLLATLISVQRRAMVEQENLGWSADDRGNHTLVAARALLQCFANSRDAGAVLEHLDVLRTSTHLMANFLHGLAAAGAENERQAEAARSLWPSLLRHAVQYSPGERNPYRHDSWGDWAAAALLPEPLTWVRGMYTEVVGAPIDWVRAEDLVGLIDEWLSTTSGKANGVDALIAILRKLPVAVQVGRGLRWVSDLCIQDDRVTVKQSRRLNDWLKDIRAAADEFGQLAGWQSLVDSLVVAGNESLAPYSR